MLLAVVLCMLSGRSPWPVLSGPPPGAVRALLDSRGRAHALRRMTLLFAQGAVGYWQYFTGVPVQLVAVHITLASITWIQLVRLAWQVEQVPTRDRVLV